MSLIVVDSTRAWRVTIGCFVINGLAVGFMKIFSLILIEYQEMLDAPMSMLLLGASMLTALLGLAAPLATYLSEKISVIKLGMLAAILSTISLLMLAFSYNIPMYIVSLMLLGLSFSFIFIPCMSISGKCHIKHQALSQGIIASGTSIVTLILPLAFAKLIYVYSCRGYVLILGAIFLNFAVGAALMPTHVLSLADPQKPVYVMCQGRPLEVLEKNVRRMRIYGYSQPSKPKFHWLPRSMLPSVMINALGIAFTINGLMVLSSLYGVYSRSFDIYITTSAYILSGHSTLEFVCRLIFGAIIDLNRCPRYLIYSISALVHGGISILTSLTPNVILFYLYIVVNAVCGSLMILLRLPVLSDVVGLSNLSTTYTIYNFIQGGLSIVCYYGVGKICDVLGSPSYGVCIAGWIQILGALLILVENLVMKKRNA